MRSPLGFREREVLVLLAFRRAVSTNGPVATGKKGKPLLFEFLYLDKATPRDSQARAVNPKKLLGGVEYLDEGRKEGKDTIYRYESEETGVTARFVAYKPEHSDEVGLAFEMELPRPTFFALEALPAALCVAREKKLSIEVLTDEGSTFYADPSFEEVLDEWKKANSRAVSDAGKKCSQGFGPVLEAMWEFALVRTDLARRYGRNRVEVPELYPVLEKKTARVGRMVDWNGLEKVALGESDWIRLIDPPKPLVDGAIYPAEELTLACKPLVRTVPQPISHYLCEKPKIIGELAARIEPLKKLTMRNFERLPFERLFDEQGLDS